MEIEIQNAVGIFFPNPYFQQIYFEAVVNAIDAGATKIEIVIKIAAFSSPDTLKVIITDILSEERMDTLIAEITLSDEQKTDDSRPDISMIFSDDPDKTAKVDVVIVELKKRTDDEKENSYALTQLLQRAEKLVQHYDSIQRIWYYAVLQINDGFATRLGQQGFSPLFSKGKVYYREAVTKAPNGIIIPTPLFVLSFDAVMNDAECRNNTFLKILREGMKLLGAEKT